MYLPVGIISNRLGIHDLIEISYGVRCPFSSRKVIAMGNYYQVACDELKERIDPGDINDLGIKAGPVAHLEHPLGALTIFNLLGRWHCMSVRLVSDAGGDDEAYHRYTDVTYETIRRYNEVYKTNIKYTRK